MTSDHETLIRRVYERDRARMFTQTRRVYAADGVGFTYESGGDAARGDPPWFRVVCEGLVLKQSANAP